MVSADIRRHLFSFFWSWILSIVLTLSLSLAGEPSVFISEKETSKASIQLSGKIEVFTATPDGWLKKYEGTIKPWDNHRRLLLSDSGEYVVSVDSSAGPATKQAIVTYRHHKQLNKTGTFSISDFVSKKTDIKDVKYEFFGNELIVSFSPSTKAKINMKSGAVTH